ncbi:MAG: hypothetical protein LQ342_002727 [Letrouitia transgressa]|nr:MAG: hypothetical protein LQ342_002727 [Letrouitia transgressa]
MPVLTRRQHVVHRKTDSPRASTDSNGSEKEHIWIVEEDYEKPQKEMDFPPGKLGNKMPRHELRINTFSKTDLHDRYLSSEEEPSPSPESSDDNASEQSEEEEEEEEELTHKTSSNKLIADSSDQVLDLSTVEPLEIAAEIAVAVPIVAYGRPKLIDITNLAPMQKRRRNIKPPVAPSSILTKNGGVAARSIPPITDENAPFVAHEAEELVIPTTSKNAAMSVRQRMKASQISISSAPDSWLPEDGGPTTDDEHYFPDIDAVALQQGPYNPYSLEQPAAILSSSNIIITPNTRHSNRRRNNSNPFNAVSTGLTRTWSLTKKHAQSQRQRQQTQQHHQAGERQLMKKPKMIARGANEREETPVIPPFPFEGSEIAVA